MSKYSQYQIKNLIEEHTLIGLLDRIADETYNAEIALQIRTLALKLGEREKDNVSLSNID